eukprot:14989118-Heterocapsa_arctica.AAC.1
MVDSGACMSTCPRGWCSWSPLRPLDKVPQAVMATGAPLVVYGTRRVMCKSWQGLRFSLTFIVTDVTRPI